MTQPSRSSVMGDGGLLMPADPAEGLSMPGRPARLAIPVVAALVDRIVSGSIPPGTTLPPEPSLAASFGISRTVVREAVKMLEQKGLARARQGLGTTVASRDDWNLLDPVVLDAAIRHDDTLEILDDLVQVRVALESDMVRAAAESMTDGDIRELGVLLAQLESQIDDPVRYLESDTRYHDFILQRSGNRLGRSIIRTIHPYARASSRYNPPTDEADVKQSHGGHVAIYRRLAARDGEGAAAAMEEHIAGAWYRRRAKRRTSQSELDPQPEE